MRATSRSGRPLHNTRSHGSGPFTRIPGIFPSLPSESPAASPGPPVPEPLRGFGEGDLRNRLGLRRRLEEWIFLEAEHLRRDVRRELPARRVVVLHLLVVAHPLDRDAVFGAGELVHQTIELLVRAELWIVLGDR